jgi:DNA-binding LytR/AlgR family response regulator
MRFTVPNTIKGLLDQLPAEPFIRVHKSFIVSKKQIIYIEGNQVRIGDPFIPIERTSKESVERQLGG